MQQVTRAADVTMAQFGSAQREPSMEEILASIRRIIEDSDTVRRADDTVQAVRPDNDPVSSATGTAPAPTAGNETSVIAVDAFRAGLRPEAAAADDRGAPTMADVQASAEDRAAARAAAEQDLADAEAAVASTLEAPHAETLEAPLAEVVATETADADDWRLGVSEPAPVEAPETMDIDVDDVADAVLRDIASAQSVSAEAVEPAPSLPEEVDLALEESEEVALETSTVDLIRQSIVSDQTGRQVAASFSELSEVLAARNRKNLDEMAEEMLRPMLQDWLDNNLPTLVERLVREEIERIARGASA